MTMNQPDYTRFHTKETWAVFKPASSVYPGSARKNRQMVLFLTENTTMLVGVSYASVEVCVHAEEMKSKIGPGAIWYIFNY